MTELEINSENICECGHPKDQHAFGDSECRPCIEKVCGEYQPRTSDPKPSYSALAAEVKSLREEIKRRDGERFHLLEVERQAKDYVSAVECECSDDVCCWKHLFETHLGNLDDTRSGELPSYTSSNITEGKQ